MIQTRMISAFSDELVLDVDCFGRRELKPLPGQYCPLSQVVTENFYQALANIPDKSRVKVTLRIEQLPKADENAIG